MFIFKWFLFWIGIAILEMGHRIIRAKFIAPKIGDFKSRQIGVASGSILILVYTWIVFPWLSLNTATDAIQVGGLWLLCMLLFEFTVGHFVFRFPWKWLLNDFNLFKGRLLMIGMLILAMAPWISGRLRGMW